MPPTLPTVMRAFGERQCCQRRMPWASCLHSPLPRRDMSVKHPIVAITGSSGAGTTTVTTTFQNIFRREGVNAVIVRGDAFHRYDRNEMRVRRTEAENNGQMHFSRFGPEANLFEELEKLFRFYGESGTGKVRNYLHDEEEAALCQQTPGTFTPWK